jgi:hypothetical protein
MEIKLANKKASKGKEDRLIMESPIQNLKTVSVTESAKAKKMPIVDAAIELKQNIENLEAQLKIIKDTLVQEAMDKIKSSADEGIFAKTVDINGSTNKIQIQVQDRYSAMDKDMIDPLTEIFEEKFNIMFKVETASKVKEEKLAALKEILGDKYEAFVEETTTVKPTGDFQYNYFLMKNNLNSDQKATVQQVLDAAQSTPAVKFPK